MSCTYKQGKRLCRIFYCGKVCVVTGDDSGVDFHHLDHADSPKTHGPGASKNNSEFNLIPITSTLHAAHHRRVQDPQLPVAKTLASIEDDAWKTFNEGLFERAYGAMRFCAFVSALSGDHDTTVRASVGCLACLRAVFRVDYACDTLVRSIIPALPAASIRAKSLLAMEVCLWLRDSGGFEIGQPYLDLAYRLSNRVKDSGTADRRQVARLQVMGAVNSVLLRRPDARDELELLERKMPHELSTVFGYIDLWRAAERRITGDLDGFDEIVHASVRRVLPSYSSAGAPRPGMRLRGTTYPPFIQTLLDAADSAARRDNVDQREAFAGLAYRFLKSTRIVPFATIPRTSLNWYERIHKFRPADRIRVRNITELTPFIELLKDVRPHLVSGLTAEP